jgi:hypothetical protein
MLFLTAFTAFSNSVYDAFGRMRAKLSGQINAVSQMVGELQVSVNQRFTDVKDRLDATVLTISEAITSANAYTDSAKTALNTRIDNLSFSIRGAGDYGDVMTDITNQIAEAEQRAEKRASLLSRVGAMKTLLLADFVDSPTVNFTTLGFVTPEVGVVTTHLLKAQGVLGLAEQAKTLTDLPGNHADVVADHADEVYISYAADGSVSVSVFNSNDASVTSNILGVQNTHTEDISGLKALVTQSSALFETQKARFDALFVD